MKSLLSLLLVSSLLLTSCKKEVETKNSASPTNVVPFTEVGKQLQTQTPVQQNPIVGNTNSNVTNAVSTGMNPAHGQPGHRCDIAVGEPLNSPAPTNINKVAAPQMITQPSQPISANTATATPAAVAVTPTAEGMNPPHGQTNHRCDIAVGAPLSK
ncbi:hypothetical protein [Flavobacterium caseinilyticum]|uniref:Uncharacterized protein n=1 Tax=Flavobacterium caseinilyticum TaxID=2541732 RepID=A0A4R5AVJ7_9FLAO|nr:hypothetical protein [Flavobacterium caseinilyticum]TDD77398.1 hypothetical protein E0F89_07360 [Flavobacterium caseinilyticum]